MDAAIVILIVLSALVGAAMLERRRNRMLAILREPETAEERHARREIPATIRAMSTAKLLAELREDLRHALAYLESAHQQLRSTRGAALLDLAGGELDMGGGGPKQDLMDSLLGDMARAQQFLAQARHKHAMLDQKGDLETTVVDHDLVELGFLDRVIDNPISDWVTFRSLSELEPRIRSVHRDTKAALATLPDVVGHA